MAPLRDRPLSNSPDPEWPPRPTTPLRIAKRDTPQRQHASQMSRRTSNTYSKLTSSSLVSQSPFRSQLPAPAKPSTTEKTLTPRKLSGEKRPRPSSMHAQAENEKPLGFKRRQSKAFQGLIEREPVTKSPFRHPSEPAEDPFPPPPPPKIKPITHLPTPTSSSSPARSSLVSKRLHGPRTIGRELPTRERRKTVTFDELCDVVTFERDESSIEEDPFTSDEEYGEQVEFDEVGEANDSITGLVDSMLEDTRGTSDLHTPPPDGSFPLGADAEDGIPYGRTHHADRLSAAHRAHPSPESFAAEFGTRITTPPQDDDSHSPVAVSTPPRNRASLAGVIATSPGSHMPLGRSTHSERVRAEHKPNEFEEDVKMLPPSPSPAKVTKCTGNGNSESLVPRFGIDVHRNKEEEEADRSAVDPFAPPLAPELQKDNFSLQPDTGLAVDELGDHSDLSFNGLAAELGLADLQQDDTHDDSHTSLPHPHMSTPPLNLRSSVNSLLRSGGSSGGRELPPPPRSRSASPFSLPVNARVASPMFGRAGSPASRSGSPSTNPSRIASPLGNPRASSSGSLGSQGSLGSLNGRSPRISREDVHKRLLRKRSIESPLHEEVLPADSQSTQPATDDHEDSTDVSMNMDVDSRPGSRLRSSIQAPTLRRDDNPTYDGVMSIDPEPQAIDPPRPSLLARAFSEDGAVQSAPSSTFKGLAFDFSGSGSGLGTDLGLSGMAFAATKLEVDEVRSALDRLIDDVAADPNASLSNHRPLQMKGSQGSLRIEAVTQGVQARQFKAPGDLDITMEEDESMADDSVDELPDAEPRSPNQTSSTQRTPELLSGGGFMSPPLSRAASGSSIAPPPPPKDAIRTREQMILEKRREMRQREEEEDMGLRTPPRNTGRAALGYGRPSKRRSMSTGDAEDMEATRRKELLGSGGKFLDVAPFEVEESLFSDTIARELVKLDGPAKSKYLVRERGETIYASSDADKVSHMSGAGDLDNGKAWKTVRRPSDMNEYAKQIREYRAQEKPGKAHGKVFVRVLDVKGLDIPFPQQATALTCTLNNGIHFVTTPECRLAKDSKVDQEFELIEHSKLEFTLTLKIRRDPHIMAQFKANAAPPPPPPAPAPPASKGGMRSFFSSPKKPTKVAPRPAAPPPKLEENLARYLKPDGTLARAFVSFKDIASHCDGRLFETTYPLIGQRLEEGGKVNPTQVGELVLQFFRLPALPGVPSNQLPQSLEECHRGLRHVHWHKMTYFEGTLTQNGGDCATWRRRQFRVIGANLVAFNDVTKRATATIDLRKAVAVEDVRDPRSQVLSPSSTQTGRSTQYDDSDALYGVERSFRLLFQRDQEILFFADTDDEKSRWLEVLNALVGRIPPNPLWAELLWQRQQELAKQRPSS
ncbi:hypothetical protein BV25DRAFT_1832375 [Artomyces pyxidatus]|uniref:Uncharacterized protein n=1 Tax=Artomyces pyxidatus TaxID=48021 RepID=A0ACB8SKH7_9AGAM|nr:hypothetical protein BV25DRAFT_1832375 [Artomyces pyxidatus]